MAEKSITDEEIAEYLSKQPKEKQKELLKKANSLRGRTSSTEKTLTGAVDALKNFVEIKKGDKIKFDSSRGGSGTGVFMSVDVYFNIKVGNVVKKIAIGNVKK